MRIRYIFLIISIVGAVSSFLLLAGYLGPIKPVLAVIMTGIWLAAVVFNFFGDVIIASLPSVRAFQKAQSGWGALNVLSTKLPQLITVGDLLQLRFEEIGNGVPPNEYNSARHIRLGRLITVASSSHPPLRHVVKELQTCSTAFTILFVIGVLIHAPSFTGDIMSELPEVLLSEKAIPILEAVTLVYLWVRMWAEVSLIKSMTEGD
jgi:hypothetical protein